jgi:hypothetical protein
MPVHRVNATRFVVECKQYLRWSAKNFGAVLADTELQNLIINHRKKNATDRTLYLEALEETALRTGRGLSFKVSYEAIRKEAAEGRYLSYKDLADASKVEWTRVRYAIGSHLGDLVEFSHRKGWPMLSAIVVNKENVDSGEMEPDTLKGRLRSVCHG